MSDTQVYWAAEEDEKKLGEHLAQRKKAHQQWLIGSDQLRWMRKSHRMYLGESPNSGDANAREVKRSGKGGGTLKVNANDYGAILRSVVTLTTSQEVSMQPRARNSDSGVESIVSVGADLLDWYMADELSSRFVEMATHAVKFGRGWLLKLADEMEGAEVDPATATPDQVIRDDAGGVVGVAREGRHVFHNLTPLDVYYDFSAPHHDACNYHICRTWPNKWDLAAKVLARALMDRPAPMEPGAAAPVVDAMATEEKVERILGAKVPGNDSALMLEDDWKNREARSDLIPVFWFLHKRSHALPEGRCVAFLDDGTILDDGPLRYTEYPLFLLEPDKRDGSADGHAPTMDLMGLQDAENASLGLALTKENNSLPVLVTTKNSGITASDLAVPYTVVTVNSKEDIPEVVVSTVSGKESVDLAGMFQRRQETISGINPVVRGNPSEALNGTASGAAYALIAEQAYTSNSPLLAGYKRVHQKVGKAVLADYPVFFPGSRKLLTVAGKKRRSMVDAFEGKSLESIDAVEVDAGNPAQRSLSSRLAMIDVINKAPPDQQDKLVEVFQTGKWDPAIENLQTEAQQIRDENEAMAQGQEIPPAVLGEDHLKHILGHVSRDMKAKLRQDYEAIRLMHIQSHVALLAWQVLDQAVVARLAAMGFMPPLPPPGVPMSGPATPNGQSVSGPPASGPTDSTAAQMVMEEANPNPASASLPDLPSPATPPGGPLQ